MQHQGVLWIQTHRHAVETVKVCSESQRAATVRLFYFSTSKVSSADILCVFEKWVSVIGRAALHTGNTRAPQTQLVISLRALCHLPTAFGHHMTSRISAGFPCSASEEVCVCACVCLLQSKKIDIFLLRGEKSALLRAARRDKGKKKRRLLLVDG